ncbi:MAG: hypothetical protein JKX74_04265, partial [Flavobacteriales bacterium]|nr:hypothetical protein [Flavobacteriales bacterium]
MRLFAVLFFLSLATFATRAQPFFQKTYGGNTTETGAAVDLTSDGGFIVGGTTNSFGSGSNDVFLVKLTASGDTM